MSIKWAVDEYLAAVDAVSRCSTEPVTLSAHLGVDGGVAGEAAGGAPGGDTEEGGALGEGAARVTLKYEH